LNISRFAAYHPVPVAVFALVAVILGFWAWFYMPVDYMPEMDIPISIVVIPWEGADPETIEEEIVKPLESFLAGAKNAKKVKAMSMDNAGVVIVEYHSFVTKREAMQNTREEIEKFKAVFQLPKGAKEPAIFQMDPAMMPILFMGFTSTKLTPRQLYSFIDQNIKPELESVEGVGNVMIFSPNKREIHVIPNVEKCLAYGITYADVITALQTHLKNLPAGDEEIGKGLRRIKVYLKPYFVPKIGKIPVKKLKDGNVIYLEDVCKIEDAVAKKQGEVSIEGIPAVFVAIRKQQGANIVSTTDAVKRKIKEILEKYPHIKIALSFEVAKFIKQSISNLTQNVITSIIIVSITVWLFLKRFSAVMAVITTIPIAFIFTLFLMYLKGMTLNMISLGGLAIAIGMLVDNAVVVTENTARLVTEKKFSSLKEAAIQGASEMILPIIASTLTSVIVFLPIAFSRGLASKFFGQLAATITFSLTISIITSFTVAVSILAKYAKPIPEGWFVKSLQTAYTKLVSVIARSGFVAFVIIGGLVLLTVGGLGVVKHMNATFISEADADDFGVVVKLPIGTNWQASKQVADLLLHEIEDRIPEVEYILQQVGVTQASALESAAFGGESGEEVISLYIRLKSDRKRTAPQIMDEIAKIVNDPKWHFTSVKFQKITQATIGAGDEFVVALYSNDEDTLEDYASFLKKELLKLPEIKSIVSTLEDKKPEVKYTIKNDVLKHFGIPEEFIRAALWMSTTGLETGRIFLDGESIKVRAKLKPKTHELFLPLGEIAIPIDNFVNKEYRLVPLVRNRYKKRSVVYLKCTLEPNTPLKTLKEKTIKLIEKSKPQSILFDFEGSVEKMEEVFSDLGKMFILSTILVYLTMAAQFESWILPFLIALLVPTDIILAMSVFPIIGKSFDVTAFLGMIVLAGIVVNNGIVFIDVFKNHYSELGADAITLAASQRLRPILITSLTTIVGMIPLALGMGKGAELRQSMGIMVGGGMTIATLVTLFGLPALLKIYTLITGTVGRGGEKK